MKNEKVMGIGVSRLSRATAGKQEDAGLKPRRYMKFLKTADASGTGTMTNKKEAAAVHTGPAEKRWQAAAVHTGPVEKRRQGAALHKKEAAVHEKVDGVEIWKQYEDLLIPRLRLTVIERAVYSHLLRHSRLEGKRRLRFTILWCARGAGLSTCSVRIAVRRLAVKGALVITERSKKGHVVEVRLPGEVPACARLRRASETAEGEPSAVHLEETDFLETRALREAIHVREDGRCFYCLRRVTSATRCIDHVIPQARNGSNSYRNLVSSCAECNAQKCEWSAEDFLRWLFREGRLGARELKERLSALEKLAAGELRPAVRRIPEKSTTRRAIFRA